MSTVVLFALFSVLFVGAASCFIKSSIGSTTKNSESSSDLVCADDMIHMFPLNDSMILSYERSSCALTSTSTLTRCKPHCHLILHQMGCPSSSQPDGLWKGDLCPTVDRYTVQCTESRFACSQYSITQLKRAQNICEYNATTVRKCFPESRSDCNKYATYSTATGSCMSNGVDDVSTISSSINPKHKILPLRNIQFELTDSKDGDDDGLIYVRTYATSEEIFEAMESSLFDPYVILFREFNPCLDELMHSSRHIVFLYLPEHGTLFEFGITATPANVSVDQIASICTLATDDHRLIIINILMVTGFGLSFGGLSLTIVSVVLTREHRNIPGINLLCLSFSLIVAYLTVAVVKFLRGIDEPCLPEGILHVVGILASLAWMNVMAFDIWNTLSKMYPAAEELSSSRKLFRYCVYGWGLPVIILVAGVLADHLPSISLQLKPRFSLSQCWFYMGFNTWGTVLFYYGPIAVMMAFNLVLFVLTARILMRSNLVQGQLSDGPRTQKKIKYLFKLYVKLFIVMGLTWVLELTNLFLPNPELFIFSDFVNTLQGFFIFVIFTCRIHVFKVFSYYCCPSRLSGVSKEDLQKYSRRFSNLQPPTSRKSSLDPNSFQANKVQKL